MAPTVPEQKCAFHTTHNLTNFCPEKSVLMPLCPQCVKQVNRDTVRGSRPKQIDTLQNAILEAKELLKKDARKTDSLRQRIRELKQLQKQYQEDIDANFTHAERRAKETVDRYFRSLETEKNQVVRNLTTTIDRDIALLESKVSAVDSQLKNYQSGLADQHKFIRKLIRVYNGKLENLVDGIQDDLRRNTKNWDSLKYNLKVDEAVLHDIHQDLKYYIYLEKNNVIQYDPEPPRDIRPLPVERPPPVVHYYMPAPPMTSPYRPGPPSLPISQSQFYPPPLSTPPLPFYPSQQNSPMRSPMPNNYNDSHSPDRPFNNTPYLNSRNPHTNTVHHYPNNTQQPQQPPSRSPVKDPHAPISRVVPTSPPRHEPTPSSHPDNNNLRATRNPIFSNQNSRPNNNNSLKNDLNSVYNH